MSRLSVLTFIRYYLPGYKSGGPVRSIANMVDALGGEYEFRIITSDRDFLDGNPYSGITTEAWGRVGKAWVYYVSPKRRGLFAWTRVIRETPHDVLYLNSLFDPIYTLLPLLAWRFAGSLRKPIVIAPRGELSPGALGLKHWKKRPFLVIAKTAGLYRNVLWHASTDDEARLIRHQFGASSRIVTARNLPAKSGHTQISCDVIESSGPLRIVFLSRICRKKNLDYALRVLARSRVEIQFDIWGPQEDSTYWSECEELIRTMPRNIVALYRGVADYSDVIKILSCYDLFFLPSRGENYGHIIAEALSAGTPVLLSDATPWRDLSAHGVGWDLPLSEDGGAFLEAIEEAARRSSVEIADWRQRVYEYAVKRLGDPTLLAANRSMFLQAVTEKTRSGYGITKCINH